jgi:uncharacterized protein YcfL
LKKYLTKISFIILILLLFVACNTTKRVAEGKRLLMKNEISVDGKEINDEKVFFQLYQKPNSSILKNQIEKLIYQNFFLKNKLTDLVNHLLFLDGVIF